MNRGRKHAAMDGIQQADGRPGTYALLLRLADGGTIPIGQRQLLALTAGWAIYVGSAFGPGGVAGRLAHHRRPVARPHWHIDYLRPRAVLEAVWYSHDPVRRECLWAAVLARELGGRMPLFRFGASDCRCPAHLSFFETRPVFAGFVAALRSRAPDHVAVIESD